MKKYLHFLSFIVIVSCNNEDDVLNTEEDYTPYPKGYFIYNKGIRDTIRLEYGNDNRVIKRIGDWVDIDNSTGFNNIFSKDVENHISYRGDQAFLTKIIKSDDITYNQRIMYKLNRQGKIVEAHHTYLSRPNF